MQLPKPRNIMALTLLATTLAPPLYAQPPVEKEKASVSVKGDITIKNKFYDGLAENSYEGEDRLRLNLAATVKTGVGQFIAGTRHDAACETLHNGYGFDFLRREFGQVQAGISRAKTPAGDAYYAQVFGKQGSCIGHLNVPLDGDVENSIAFAECTRTLGTARIRATVLDNFGLDRIQNSELALSMPLRGKARIEAGIGAFGTPQGYEARVELGVTVPFSHSF